jgi:hypothetical protein
VGVETVYPSLGACYTQAAHWFEDLIDSEGPDLATNAHKKVLEEAQELHDAPSLEEAADVFISLVGTCVGRGWSGEDLADAIFRKLLINQSRTWHKQAGGTWRHD